MSKTILHTADTRGHADHGWLNAHHSFSFAGFYDPERVQFGALRVLNDDAVAPGMGFGKHPHDNMEIITIVLEGTLEHKDSMGHAQGLHPNEVQVMSAGSGIFHSEYNQSAKDVLKLLQIWIFPNERNVEPRYDQRIFSADERVNKLQLLVSPKSTDDEGMKIHQNAWISRTRLEAGKDLDYTLHDEQNGVYAFVIKGNVIIEGQSLNKRDAMGVYDVKSINIKSGGDTDLLLLEVPMNY